MDGDRLVHPRVVILVPNGAEPRFGIRLHRAHHRVAASGALRAHHERHRHLHHANSVARGIGTILGTILGTTLGAHARRLARERRAAAGKPRDVRARRLVLDDDGVGVLLLNLLQQRRDESIPLNHLRGVSLVADTLHGFRFARRPIHAPVDALAVREHAVAASEFFKRNLASAGHADVIRARRVAPDHGVVGIGGAREALPDLDVAPAATGEHDGGGEAGGSAADDDGSRGRRAIVERLGGAVRRVQGDGLAGGLGGGIRDGAWSGGGGTRATRLEGGGGGDAGATRRAPGCGRDDARATTTRVIQVGGSEGTDDARKTARGERVGPRRGERERRRAREWHCHGAVRARRSLGRTRRVRVSRDAR